MSRKKDGVLEFTAVLKESPEVNLEKGWLQKLRETDDGCSRFAIDLGASDCPKSIQLGVELNQSVSALQDFGFSDIEDIEIKPYFT